MEKRIEFLFDLTSIAVVMENDVKSVFEKLSESLEEDVNPPNIEKSLRSFR